MMEEFTPQPLQSGPGSGGSGTIALRSSFTESSVCAPASSSVRNYYVGRAHVSSHVPVPSSRHMPQHPEIELLRFRQTNVVHLRFLSAPQFGLFYEKRLR